MNTERRATGTSMEFILEIPEITPESLLADNKSEEAIESLNNWENAKTGRKQTAMVACGDARLILPYRTTMSMRTIATGSVNSPQGLEAVKPILESVGVNKIITVGHFNGDTAIPGEAIRGCGGLQAKEEGQTRKSGILRFVEEHIQHQDVVLQTLISASKIAATTDKPVLAAIMNHRDGTLYPLAVYSYFGTETIRNFGDDKIIPGSFDPRILYAGGIPAMEEEQIPEIFRDVLDEQTRNVEDMKRLYPDLHKRQEVQNPVMIAISTETRSMKIRFPNTAREPGSIFKLHIPRSQSGNSIDITFEDMRNAANQLDFPIKQANKNYGEHNKSFSKTSVLFIETEDIQISIMLAFGLFRERWMQKWTELPGHSVIVAQTKGGETSEVKIIKP